MNTLTPFERALRAKVRQGGQPLDTIAWDFAARALDAVGDSEAAAVAWAMYALEAELMERAA